MLLVIRRFEDLDARKLMDVYAESNAENVPYFYPDCTDAVKGVKMVEEGFLNYLKTEFFAVEGNIYCVYEEKGVWLSALRLNFIKDGLYYIEALETRPDSRKCGYGEKLINEVLNSLKPPFKVQSSVGKRNLPSVKFHEKCGFERKDVAEDLLSGEVDEGCYGFVYART